MQRFAVIPTHEIEKALLQGNWTEAVDLILKPREGEQDYNLAEARDLYQKTKDPCQAYQILGRTDKIEAKLFWGLNICGYTNFQGALDMVPKTTMLMYVHAYQSKVWNEIVSWRIKEFGLKQNIRVPKIKRQTRRMTGRKKTTKKVTRMTVNDDYRKSRS